LGPAAAAVLRRGCRGVRDAIVDDALRRCDANAVTGDGDDATFCAARCSGAPARVGITPLSGRSAGI